MKNINMTGKLMYQNKKKEGNVKPCMFVNSKTNLDEKI